MSHSQSLKLYTKPLSFKRVTDTDVNAGYHQNTYAYRMVKRLDKAARVTDGAIIQISQSLDGARFGFKLIQ